MEPITYHIRLDASKSGVQAVLNAKKGDARMRRVVVHLYSGATPFELPEAGVIATLYATKPDGTKVFKYADVEGDALSVTLTSQMLAAVGLVNCELQVIGANGELLTSPRFDIEVEDTLSGDDEESADELTALTEALSRVANIEQSEQSRVDAEAARVAAEDERVAAEEARAAAETERAEDENERGEAEKLRVVAEQAREEAEAARAAAEIERETAESAREQAVTEAIEELDEKTTGVFDDVDARIEAAIATSDAAVNAAVGRANTAAVNAENAASSADAAAARANTAADTANTAATGADTAASNAGTASASANTAATKADAAADRANAAADAVEDLVGGVVSWETILDKPTAFPPTDHEHDIDAIRGLGDELTAKAPLDSPTFTGTPSAPTAPKGTNDKRLATTEFVQNAVAQGGGAADWDNLNGKPDRFPPTDHTHQIADVIGLGNELNTRAPLDSPALTGVPIAPTPGDDAGPTQIATVEYVKEAVKAGGGGTVGIQLQVNIDTGSTVTVSDGVTELTEIAENGKCLFDLPNYGSWDITAELGGQTANSSIFIDTAKLYVVDMAYFEATLTVSTGQQGAEITVTDGGNTTYTATAGVDGSAAIAVKKPGTFTVKARYQNADSSTDTVAVTDQGASYSATVSFIVLTVTIDAGSTLKVTDGMTSFDVTATGSDVFYLPNTGTWTATATLGAETAADSVEVTEYRAYLLELAYVRIYGVEWDGTSTTKWSRTDESALFTDPVPYVDGSDSYSSPFDDRMPWSGMVRSTDAAAGELVAIPKFWYQLEQLDSGGMHIRIADKKVDGFSVAPAHMDRGDGKGERDVVYIGRYHCASDYKSTTGVKPIANITRATARTAIHNLGTDIWQNDFATRFTIWLLYLVEFAEFNSQAAIGYGCGNNSATENMGYTDAMPYHTGTMLANRTTYGVGTQYRNIEGLWDNVYDWCDGCYNSSAGLNLILNPNSFSDSAGGTSVGVPSSGWPSKFTVSDKAGFDMFIPSAASGSESTYSCDNWGFGASVPVVCVGGYYNQGANRGMFCVDYGAAANTGAGIGSRLLKLP